MVHKPNSLSWISGAEGVTPKSIPSGHKSGIFLRKRATHMLLLPISFVFDRMGLIVKQWGIYILRSLFPLHFWDQSQWICRGLLSVYLRIYQELPSPPVLCLPICHSFKGLTRACLSPLRIHLTTWLWSHLPLAVL